MSTRTPTDCPHELRPGTSVCLHCLAVERAAGRRRAKQTALRLISGAFVVAGGTLAARQLAFFVSEPAVRPAAESAPTVAADVPAERPAEPQAPSVRPGTDEVVTVGEEPMPTPMFRPAAAITITAPAPTRRPGGVTPTVREGTSDIGGGMIAERRGDTVTVHFDTELNRTRRADKFERIVRATLPRLYGAPVEAALAGVPEGALVRGDPTRTLPRTGLQLRLPDGGTLAVWPTTRAGRDGPLVVTYVATVMR